MTIPFRSFALAACTFVASLGAFVAPSSALAQASQNILADYPDNMGMGIASRRGGEDGALAIQRAYVSDKLYSHTLVLELLVRNDAYDKTISVNGYQASFSSTDYWQTRARFVGRLADGRDRFIVLQPGHFYPPARVSVAVWMAGRGHAVDLVLDRGTAR